MRHKCIETFYLDEPVRALSVAPRKIQYQQLVSTTGRWRQGSNLRHPDPVSQMKSLDHGSTKFDKRYQSTAPSNEACADCKGGFRTSPVLPDTFKMSFFNSNNTCRIGKFFLQLREKVEKRTDKRSKYLGDLKLLQNVKLSMTCEATFRVGRIFSV